MSEIRKATEADWDQIWVIFHAVVKQGETYAYDPETPENQARETWLPYAYAAFEGNRIVGTYMMKPNQPGLGSHVANAGFMVSPDHEGKGIGRRMGLHSLGEAKNAGYEAMQFNFVVSVNTRAVALWQSLGFSIVGTVPKAFRHAKLGLVDVYVMHRFV